MRKGSFATVRCMDLLQYVFVLSSRYFVNVFFYGFYVVILLLLHVLYFYGLFLIIFLVL